MSARKNLYKFSFGKIQTEFEENLAISNPYGRSGHRIVSCHKNIYVYGGFNPSRADSLVLPELVGTTLFLEIWCFNISSKVWKKICSWTRPVEVASTIVKKIGNSMVIHGGTGVPFGLRNSTTTYLKNITKGDLRALDPTGEVPIGRYGQAGVVDEKNKLFYVVGGTTGDQFSLDVHCFDFKINKWKQLSYDEPRNIPARYRHEIALYDSKIYMFGGGTLDEVFGFEQIPVFDLITKKWSVIHSKGSTFPHPRRCHSGVMVPGDNYNDPYYVISGGLATDRSFNDVWSFNFRLEKWCKFNSSLPFKLYFHDAVFMPHGQMIVFGGLRAAEQTRNPQFRTNAVYSCWVKLPKLSEIAWEAIRYYCPDIWKLGSQELRRLGIPWSLASRIDMEH